MPSPNSAVASGRPAATSVPNVSSSTTAAIARPTVSDEISPCWARATGWPPSSTRRPSRLAASAIVISCSPVALGTSSAFDTAAAYAGHGDPAVARHLRVARGHAVADAVQPLGAAEQASIALWSPRAPRVLRLPDDVDGDGVCCGKRSASCSSAALDSDPGVE